MTIFNQSLHHARLLIINDHEADNLHLENVLHSSGYSDVRSLTDPLRALDLYRSFAPDLVLLDVRMPDLDGLAVLALLRGVIPEETYLPILLLTTDLTSDAKLQAVTNGAQDFLTRPFDPGEILLRIENLLKMHFLYLQSRDQAQHLAAQVAERQEAEMTRTNLAAGVEYSRKQAEETRFHLAAAVESSRMLAEETRFHLAAAVESSRLLAEETRTDLAATVESSRMLAEETRSHLAAAVESSRMQAEIAARRSRAQLKIAQADLRRSERLIVQQERLRALGEMASGIAHDFNNALVPIVGFSELLLADPLARADPEMSTRYLGLIQSAAQDAAQIVRRLREFSRARDEISALQAVDLDHLLRETCALTQPKWKGQAQTTGAAIEVVIQTAEAPPILGNAADLREVVMNLIFNAVDALPEGGTITLSTRTVEDRVLLEVADDGMGMTEAIRLKCLEPFFSTKGEHGTGLGLAMVYGIVTRHQGTIEIESQLGQGTTFRIGFPIGAAGAAPTEPVEAQEPSQALRILVVDDEQLIVEVLSRYLMQDGHHVETATGGEAGLVKLRAGAFDLAITDRSMPGMSGDQFALGAKDIRPDLRIIMLTGFGHFMVESAVQPRGVDLVVGKPVRQVALRKAVLRVMKAESLPLVRN